MEKVLYVRINHKSYRLYQLEGVWWRLFYLIDRQKLNTHASHGLDFWRLKGVIHGEEEKGS